MIYERTRLRPWIALAAVFAAAFTVCCAPLMAAQPPAAPSDHCAPAETAPQGPETSLGQCCLLLAAEMKHPVQIVPAFSVLAAAIPFPPMEMEAALAAARPPVAFDFSPTARERLTQHICVLLI